MQTLNKNVLKWLDSATSKEVGRENISQPYCKNGCIYATNGHVIHCYHDSDFKTYSGYLDESLNSLTNKGLEFPDCSLFDTINYLNRVRLTIEYKELKPFITNLNKINKMASALTKNPIVSLNRYIVNNDSFKLLLRFSYSDPTNYINNNQGLILLDYQTNILVSDPININVNALYLYNALKIAEYEKSDITITYEGADGHYSPIEILVNNSNYPDKFRAVVMPCNTSEN